MEMIVLVAVISILFFLLKNWRSIWKKPSLFFLCRVSAIIFTTILTKSLVGIPMRARII